MHSAISFIARTAGIGALVGGAIGAAAGTALVFVETDADQPADALEPASAEPTAESPGRTLRPFAAPRQSPQPSTGTDGK